MADQIIAFSELNNWLLSWREFAQFCVKKMRELAIAANTTNELATEMYSNFANRFMLNDNLARQLVSTLTATNNLQTNVPDK